MNGFKMTAALLGMLVVGCAPSLRADDFNKETHFTISQPLQLQDTVLAPGSYVLRLAAPNFNQVLVSIYDGDGIRLEQIALGFAAYRSDAGDTKLISVSQPQGDQPSKLKTWFYPGENIGVEFAEKDSVQSVKPMGNTTGQVTNPKGKGQPAGAPSSNASGH
jgi:hypothetical protein